MRIISGKHKGIKLLGPKQSRTRPIANKAKERLFSYLGEEIAGKKILDLYAGTGSIGLEALSRNCDSVTFVELNYSAICVLQRNIQICNAIMQTKTINQDTLKYLRHSKDCYDIIFSAPPYKRHYYMNFLLELDRRIELLNDYGLIILECNKHERSIGAFKNLKKIKEIIHNETIFEIWIKCIEVSPSVQEQQLA